MVMKNLSHAPLVFNGVTIPISELPQDIRESEFTVALQMMLERGYFGEYPPGTEFFDVIRFDTNVVAFEEMDDGHQERWDAICEQLDIIHDLEARGEDTKDLRKAYQRSLKDHDMLSKLSRP